MSFHFGSTILGTAFGRVVQVTIGTRAQPNIAQYGNSGPDATALRVAFDIKKNIKATPNTATVTLFNMAPKNRNSLLPGMNVTVFAGYQDMMQLLFVGVIDTVKSTRGGADVATVMSCLDGGSAITGSLFMRQYGTATLLTDIFHDIAARMAMVSAANPPGLSASAVLGVDPTATTNAFLTLSGTCRDVLTQVCQPRGLEWSIQNGALQVISKVLHFGDKAEVVSPATGLIGVPSINKDLCEFVCLLNPNIQPGRMIFLNTRDAVGYFKVRGGKWTGDTHDTKWQSEVQAVSLPGVVDLSSVGVSSPGAFPLVSESLA